MIEPFLFPLAGLIVGLIVGITGVGGGALMAPILLLAFDMDPLTVVATDLLFATITKLAVTQGHHKNALIDWQIATRLWSGSIPATLTVLIFVQQGLVATTIDWITHLIGVLILVSAISMVFSNKIQIVFSELRVENPRYFLSLQPLFTRLAGVILGSLVTITSIGAGALGAVFLKGLYPLRMEPKKLIATDTIHAIPVSMLGGVSYLLLGFTDVPTLALLLIGSIPGAILGGKIMFTLPVNAMRIILSVVLSVAGWKLLQT